MPDAQSGEKKPKEKLASILWATAGLIVVAGLIIGGAVLASKKWDPKWNPFRQKVTNESYI